MNELDTIFDLNMTNDDLQKNEAILESRKLKRVEKQIMKNRLRMEEAAEILNGEIPAENEAHHIVSNGKFDYWNFVPLIIDILNKPIKEAYFSTWTLNRRTCRELFELFDSGKIQKYTFLTGIYFKTRETAVYSTLANGTISRGQRLKSLENHSKIVLLDANPDFIVIEGSANFTANPRIEQNTITNSKKLFDFHQNWIDGIFNK